jgi:hypothetical protein
VPLRSGQQRGIVGDTRRSVDAQRLRHAGDEKEGSKPRVRKKVGEAIKAIVADAIGQQQVAIVENAHKARRVAARRHIGPLGPLRADDAECRACQDGTAVLVEAAQDLAARAAHRLWVYVAQGLDCRDVADLRGVEALHHRSTPRSG